MISDNTPTFTVYKSELGDWVVVLKGVTEVHLPGFTSQDEAKLFGFDSGWAFLSQLDWKGDE
jgi:hypothetical protein